MRHAVYMLCGGNPFVNGIKTTLGYVPLASLLYKNFVKNIKRT